MDSPEAGRSGSSRSGAFARRSVRLWGLLLFAAAFAVAILIVNRRGARVLAPPPDASTTDEEAPRPVLPPSTVSMSIRMDLAVLERALEERIPSSFGTLDERRTHPGNPRLSYAVRVEREPLALEARRDTLRLTTVVHYDARVWFDSPLGGELDASCERPERSPQRPRALLTIATPVEVGPGWRIDVEPAIEELRPASDEARDRCTVRVGPLRMDATDLLLAAARARVEEVADELDRLMDGVDLSPMVEPHWLQLQEPVPLAPDVWLALHPDSLRLGSLEGVGARGRTLATELAVTGRPRIVVGPPPPASRTPLPALRRGPVPERFAALLEARIEYEAASRTATEALRSREITVRGRTVRVEGIRVTSIGGGRLGVHVDVEGAVRGRLYLVGTPSWDADAGRVTVPDLRFSVETRSVLLRSAAWLARGAFPSRIQQAVRWNAANALERARVLAARGLDRRLGGGARMSGRLDRAEVLSVSAAGEGLLIRARAEGRLAVGIEVEPGLASAPGRLGAP